MVLIKWARPSRLTGPFLVRKLQMTPLPVARLHQDGGPFSSPALQSVATGVTAECATSDNSPTIIYSRLWTFSMASRAIFYSWMSDRPSSTNERIIEECLEKALTSIAATSNLVPALDRDI